MKDAAEKARELLATALPHRWQHTYAVAQKAASFAKQADLGDVDAELLIAAAWLHNLGYSPAISKHYDFPPLDGAHQIAEWGHGELAALVAWHGLSAEESVLLGIDSMMVKYPCPTGLVPDLLAYADMTTSSDGVDVSPQQRFAEILDRYPPNHSSHQALLLGWPRIEGLVNRAEAALGVR